MFLKVLIFQLKKCVHFRVGGRQFYEVAVNAFIMGFLVLRDIVGGLVVLVFPAGGKQFEQQINEFITNRKNIVVKHKGEDIKLPDISPWPISTSQTLQNSLRKYAFF